MDRNLKKIIFIGFLIIYILTFYMMLLLGYVVFLHILRLPLSGFFPLYINVLIDTILISMILLWFPIVHFKGLLNARLICFPFLLISLLLFFILTSYIEILLAVFILGIGSGGSLFIISFVLVNNDDESETKIRSSAIALIISLLIVVVSIEVEKE